LQEALKSATPGNVYGGLGKLRLTFDLSALGNPNPDDVLVTASIKWVDGTESERVALGVHPATATVNVGVVKINQTYVVRADAALAASPSIPLGNRTEVPIMPSAFDTTVVVTLVP